MNDRNKNWMFIKDHLMVIYIYGRKEQFDDYKYIGQMNNLMATNIAHKRTIWWLQTSHTKEQFDDYKYR